MESTKPLLDTEETSSINSHRKQTKVQFSKDVLVTQFDRDDNRKKEDEIPQKKTLLEIGSKEILTPKKGKMNSIQMLLGSLKQFKQTGKSGEDYQKVTQERAGQVLQLLQDESEDEQPDAMKQMKSANLFFLAQTQTAKWEEEENPTEEYLEEKEVQRQVKLRKDRGRRITLTFDILFHVTVFFNFLFSWIDSAKTVVEEAKFQQLFLKNEYNCLGILETADVLDHTVNIIHALMSACVLFSDHRINASLCIAYVISQAIHTSFKGFIFFLKLRFEESDAFMNLALFLMMTVLFDVVTSVVVIQKFYDLTDRIRARARYFSTSVQDGKSMNDDIIYQNQSSFLQRKHILREAIASQVFTVILKIDNYKKKGLEADNLALYRELHAAKLALEDVDGVENKFLLKDLKMATAKRLKELDMNPELLPPPIGGSMSKIFKVDFGDR